MADHRGRGASRARRLPTRTIGRGRPLLLDAFKEPGRGADHEGMFDVSAALRELVEKNGSDLHLKVGARPLFRVHGVLTPSETWPELTAGDTEGALHALLDDSTKLDEFADEHEVDFSFEIAGVARYRVNAFRQRGVISLACRAIPNKISTIEELALPPVVTELAEEE